MAVEHIAHLLCELTLAGVRVKVARDRNQPVVRKLHFADYRRLAAQAFFTARHLIKSVFQPDAAYISQRIPAEDRIAVQTEIILALGIVLESRALGEIQVARHETVVHAQFARDLAGHIPVACAGHAEVGLREEQNVGLAQVRMRAQGIELSLQLDAALKIPRNNPVAIACGGRLRGEVTGLRRIKHFANRRLDVLIEGTRHEFLGRPAAPQFGEARHDLFADEAVYFVKGRQVGGVDARRRAFISAGNRRGQIDVRTHSLTSCRNQAASGIALPEARSGQSIIDKAVTPPVQTRAPWSLPAWADVSAGRRRRWRAGRSSYG